MLLNVTFSTRSCSRFRDTLDDAASPLQQKDTRIPPTPLPLPSDFPITPPVTPMKSPVPPSEVTVQLYAGTNIHWFGVSVISSSTHPDSVELMVC
jgi:hypothetical protein